jgi:mycofactocin system glycosyltransferase
MLRLSPAGAAQLDRWLAGEPVGPGPAEGRLAGRLVDAGVAAPLPPARPAGSPRPSLAVVVPVHDDPGGLAATLGALEKTAPGAQILVVDDGSSPPAASGGHPLLRRPNGGPAAARNTGWNASGPVDLVAFVDAGAVPTPGWLERLVPYFDDPVVAAAAPRIRSQVAVGLTPGLARAEQYRTPLDLGPRTTLVFPGGAVAYVPSTVLVLRRRDLEACGGFDESLRFGEDVDLVWRLVARRRRVVYDPAAMAWHPSRSTTRAWLRQRFDYGSSAAPLATRHGQAVAPLAGSPWSTAAWLLVGLGHPLAGAALSAGSAAALARRAGRDRLVGTELARLALAGTFRSARPLASAIRRAWLPPALAGASLAWRFGDRRARIALAAGAIGVSSSDGGLWALLDDLAYQSGVWAGVIRQRSGAALLPRW